MPEDSREIQFITIENHCEKLEANKNMVNCPKCGEEMNILVDEVPIGLYCPVCKYFEEDEGDNESGVC